MDKPDLDGRQFKSILNSENGEVSSETIFHYRQKGQMIWADYGGGEIVKGHLLGSIVGDHILKFSYHHLNIHGNILTGKCISTVSWDSDDKILLSEEWEWTCGDFSKGTSLLREI